MRRSIAENILSFLRMAVRGVLIFIGARVPEWAKEKHPQLPDSNENLQLAEPSVAPRLFVPREELEDARPDEVKPSTTKKPSTNRPRQTYSRVSFTPVRSARSAAVGARPSVTKGIQDKVQESTLIIDRKLGGGGEANVFLLGRGAGSQKAFKKFHDPDEYDLGDPIQRVNSEIAQQRHNEYPIKLPSFPSVPDRVIAPETLVVGSRGKIEGYLMPFVKGEKLSTILDPKWRKSRNMTVEEFSEIMLDLHDTITALHAQGFVVGDFKPDNVIVKDGKCYMVDAESMQFGKYTCLTFTEGYVDPLLLGYENEGVTRLKNHNQLSDWFAYTVMIFQGLIGCTPFDGTLKDNRGQYIDSSKRLVESLTLFEKGAKWPEGTVKPTALPDELIGLFHKVFVKKARGKFPRILLERLMWHDCPSCRFEHGRSVCPNCKAQGPVMWTLQVTETEVSFAHKVLKTDTPIQFGIDGDDNLTVQERRLIRNGIALLEGVEREQVLGATFFGEHTALILSMDPDVGYLMTHGSKTPQRLGKIRKDQQGRYLLGANERMLVCVLEDGKVVGLPSNSLKDFHLIQEGHATPWLWVGPNFSLILSENDEHVDQSLPFANSERFVLKKLEGTKPGASDVSWMPQIVGKVLDASCTFAADGSAWLTVRFKEAGKPDIRILKVAISEDGSLIGSFCIRENTAPSWLQDFRIQIAESRIKDDGTREPILRIMDEQVLYTLRFEIGELVVEAAKLSADAKAVIVDAKEIRDIPGEGFVVVGQDMLFEITSVKQEDPIATKIADMDNLDLTLQGEPLELTHLYQSPTASPKDWSPTEAAKEQLQEQQGQS